MLTANIEYQYSVKSCNSLNFFSISWSSFGHFAKLNLDFSAQTGKYFSPGKTNFAAAVPSPPCSWPFFQDSNPRLFPQLDFLLHLKTSKLIGHPPALNNLAKVS